jgi:hypothetical protein
MKILGAIASLVFLVSAGAAGAQQRELSAAELASVEGVVMRADTGEPLRRAVITIRVAEGRGTPFTVATDIAGRFRIEGLPPGRYRLTVDRTGFVRAEYGQRAVDRPGSVLALAPGEQLRDVVLRMSPAGVITGRVWDEYGDAVVGAQVRLFRYRYADGRRQLAPAGSAQTNDLGEYRLFGLTPGQYYLSVAPTRVMTIDGRPGAMPIDVAGAEETFAATYYPGTADPSRALPIEVRAGEEARGIDVALQQVRTVTVRGNVTGLREDGARGGEMVRLQPRGAGANIAGAAQAPMRRADGRFEFRRVVPGSYTLTAMTAGTGAPWFAREVLEVGGADIEGLRLTMLPAGEVRGRIRVEGRAEFPFASLSVRLDAEGVSYGAQFRTGAPGDGGRATTSAEGEFRIHPLPPQRYGVSVVNAPEGFYLREVLLEGRDVLDGGFEVRPGITTELELVLSPAGGRVTGIVLDNERQPAAAATVALIPAEPRQHLRRLYHTVQTDPNGQFLLQGLTPGDYLLFAWDDLEPGQHLDPDFFSRYLDRARRVRVEEGEVRLVELPLLSAAR